MNVSFTPELEAMVREQVASGRYNNASEVVRDAHRRLERDQQLLAQLRALAQGGLDRREPVEFTDALMEEIDRDADERVVVVRVLHSSQDPKELLGSRPLLDYCGSRKPWPPGARRPRRAATTPPVVSHASRRSPQCDPR